jgi:hypothetical protein
LVQENSLKPSRWLLNAAFAGSLLFVASCGDDDSGNTGDGGSDGGSSDASTPDSGGGGSGKCGDGVAQGDELCDGSDLRHQTCTSATMGAMSSGTLRCKTNCTFDVSACSGEEDGGNEADGGMGGTGG